MNATTSAQSWPIPAGRKAEFIGTAAVITLATLGAWLGIWWWVTRKTPINPSTPNQSADVGKMVKTEEPTA